MQELEAIQAGATLQANKARILKLWEERARHELPPARFKDGLALRDHLPHLIDNIIAVLSPDKPTPQVQDQVKVGIQHGTARADFGDYSIGQTLAEYTILRKTIFVVLEVEAKTPLTGIERDIILDCLSLATLGSANEFSRREKERLRISNEELQRFAFVASHDLQEPLRMVSSYIHLIERELADQLHGKTREHFEYVSDGASRMSALINSLLDYARVGSDHDSEARTNLNRALSDAIRNLDLLIKDSGAKISAEPLPHVQGSLTAYVIVFQNLINNAIKYRREEVPRISISPSVNGDRCIISVADNGIGIAPEHREKIFGLFNRLHTRAEYPGVGIGLGLCRRIVGFYGGRIWVEPNPTGGSIFRFVVPVDQE